MKTLDSKDPIIYLEHSSNEDSSPDDEGKNISLDSFNDKITIMLSNKNTIKLVTDPLEIIKIKYEVINNGSVIGWDERKEADSCNGGITSTNYYSNKASYDIKDCTCYIITAKDKKGENISFVTHQHPNALSKIAVYDYYKPNNTPNLDFIFHFRYKLKPLFLYYIQQNIAPDKINKKTKEIGNIIEKIKLNINLLDYEKEIFYEILSILKHIEYSYSQKYIDHLTVELKKFYDTADPDSIDIVRLGGNAYTENNFITYKRVTEEIDQICKNVFNRKPCVFGGAKIGTPKISNIYLENNTGKLVVEYDAHTDGLQNFTPLDSNMEKMIMNFRLKNYNYN